jgi:branched-chain amino acid transport system substrate-binding protein
MRGNQREQIMSEKTSTNKMIAAIVVVVVMVGIGVGVLITYTPSTPPAPTKIIVGWTEPKTGGLASLLMYDMYYKWIIEDYNATGGLYIPQYGKKIPFGTPIVYDDTSSISTMLAEYTKLITVDHVNLLFAPISTAMNYALFPLIQEYKMPIVSLTFGSDIAGAKMRDGTYSYAFSVLGFPGETADQLVQVFQYINTTVDPGKLNSVGIIYDSDQHGVEYGAAIDTALVLSGFSVPVYEGYPYPAYMIAGPTAFAGLVADLQAAKVDVVVVAGYEGGWFESECNSLNYHPKLIVSGPGMETPIWMTNLWGLTPAQYNGTMLYDGWPATDYTNGTALGTWAYQHYNRSITEGLGIAPPWGGAWPFPSSATFYAGLQCLFDAVEQVGLNGTAIRNALATDTFTTIVGQTHLRQGESMQCSLAGTVTQWQGGKMCQVVWPLNATQVSPIIYPMPTYKP